MTKATFLLFNTERLIDLSEEYLTTILLSSLTTAFSKSYKKDKQKENWNTISKITTILKSLSEGQNMSVGVFPFMLQLLVYVREKYKNYSSLFGAFYYYNPGQKVLGHLPFFTWFLYGIRS